MPGRALVTGASSGIGAAVVSRLLAIGWDVVGLSRSPPAPGCEHVMADLEDEAAVDAALVDIGPVDAIIHAAGVLRVGKIDALDRADGA